jgi:hypothetical protein
MQAGTYLGPGHEGPFRPSKQEGEGAMRIRAVKISMLCAMLVALVLVTTASAQSSPAQTVYDSTGEVLNVVAGGSPEDEDQPPTAAADTGGEPTPPVRRETGTTPVATSGELPFTGFQAGLVAAAGLALLGAGVAMRRLGRHDA